MGNEVLVLSILLLASAFFSSTEISFIVANKIKIEIRARKNRLAEKNVMFFLKRPEIFFSTILISNNAVNIAFTSILTYLLTVNYHLSDFSILLISSVVLLLGELLPKYFARESADFFILLSAFPLRIIYFILFPFVKITSLLSSKIINNNDLKGENLAYLFDKVDLHQLVEESKQTGTVGESISDLFKKVIDLGEQRIYEAMTPRTGVYGVEINDSIEQVINEFIDTGYSKLPVYEENLDNIKGIIFYSDMFKNPKDIASIIKEAMFVPETKKSLDLLNELLEKHTSIAIVVDEFGGTAGIITLEDIIEELFGEIQDEYDDEEYICRETKANEYIISGKVEIDYINDKLYLNLPEGDYETFGGFITNSLGRIPLKDEKIKIENFLLHILKADNKKITLVKLIHDKESI